MTNSVRSTRTPVGGTVDRRRKLGTGLLLLLGLFAGFIGLAPSAFAHHAYVQGNVASVCDPTSGQIRVTFNVNSWGTVSSGQRVLNSSVGIQYRLSDTPTFPADPDLTGFSSDVTTGAFTDNNSGATPTFTSNFLLAASNAGKYLQVRAYPKGNWVNGAGTSSTAPNATTDDSWVIAPQPLASGCTPPANPSATATLECAQQRVRVSFTGVGAATTVDIRKNGVIVASPNGDDFPVPVGGPTTFDIPLTGADEDDPSLDIDLDYLVGTDQSFDIAVNCLNPNVQLNPVAECITGAGGVQGVNVTVTNTGAQAGSITLATVVNGAAGPSLVFTNVAPNGGTSTQFLAVPEDGTYSVSGPNVTTQSGTNDCAQAQIALNPVAECITGAAGALGVNVTVTNTGAQAGSITLTTVVNGVAGPSLVFTNVAPNGGTSTQFLAVPEDGTYAVSGPGVTTQSGTNDCGAPDLSLQSVVECATVNLVQGVHVTVINNGTQAGSITATTTVGGVAGPVLTFTNVAPNGGTSTQFLAVPEDNTYSVTVGGVTTSGSNDCAEANLGLVGVVECAIVNGVQGINVTISNNGAQAGSATVTPTVGGVVGAGIVFNVPASGSVTHFIAVGEDVGYSLSFAGDFGTPQANVTGTNDCVPTDVCANIPGNQPVGTDCTPPCVPTQGNNQCVPCVAPATPTGQGGCTPPPCVPTDGNNQCVPCAPPATPTGDGECTPPCVPTDENNQCTPCVDGELPDGQGGCEPPVVDVCAEIPGNQPEGTDCDPPVVDVCADMPGNQPEGTDCDPPVVDVCPDMPGNQPTGTDCTEVQGNVVTPTTLPRTGTSALNLLPLAGALLLAGMALVGGGRRRLDEVLS